MFLMIAVLNTQAGDCGSAGNIWPADEDGSLRLAFGITQNKDSLELIYREGDNIIIARGLLADGSVFREIYALYDLTNGNMVHAVAKVRASTTQINEGVPAEYHMQSHFDIQLYAADKTYNDKIKELLTKNRQTGCHEEINKLWQMREIDKEKCADTINELSTIMAQRARPKTGTLKKLTETVQIQKYLDKIRTAYINGKKSVLFTNSNDPDDKIKTYCIGIQKMDIAIIEKLRKPQTQQELVKRNKMPDYLEDPKNYEKTTIKQIW